MSIKYNIDERLKAIYDKRALDGSKTTQSNRRLPYGLVTNDDYLALVCAYSVKTEWGADTIYLSLPTTAA